MRRCTSPTSFVVCVALSAIAGCAVGEPTYSQRQAIGASASTMEADTVWDPFDVFGFGSVGEVLAAGTVRCGDGEPAGRPAAPCPRGASVSVRDFAFVLRVESADERMDGWATIHANADWDANGVGREWGTFRDDLNAGGTWEGTFEGTRALGEPEDCSTTRCWTERLRLECGGMTGVVLGLHASMTEHAVSYELVKIASTSHIVTHVSGRARWAPSAPRR